MDAMGVAAIVTGGASGLGAATAQALSAAGAKVTVLDRDGNGAVAVANTIGESSNKWIPNATPIGVC